MVIFNKSTNLGLMRVRLKSTVVEMNKIFENIFNKLNSPKINEQTKATFTDDFKKAAESELDDLFG